MVFRGGGQYQRTQESSPRTDVEMGLRRKPNSHPQPSALNTPLPSLGPDTLSRIFANFLRSSWEPILQGEISAAQEVCWTHFYLHLKWVVSPDPVFDDLVTFRRGFIAFCLSRLPLLCSFAW